MLRRIVPRPFLAALSLVLSGLCLQAAPAAAREKPASTPLAGAHLEVIQLESDPPEKIRSAPGGGRTLAPAMLYTPSSGANPHGPAIIILDDGPGSHPMASDQAARFAAGALASRGYTVLSPYTGQERNFPTVPFADNRWALKSAIDFLEHAGYEDIAIVAQGYGAIVAADYIKSLPDRSLDNGPERRVKAVALLNPALEPSGYPGFGNPAGLTEREALAKRLVADGTGLFPAMLEPGHNVGKAQADWFLQGRYSMPAQGWLEYWGSDARARNVALLQDLPLPVLILAGDMAAMAPAGEVAALARPGTEVEMLAGLGNDLSPAAGKVVASIQGWLDRHDLAVRAAVHTSPIDVRLPDGRRLYGLEYAPTKAPSPTRPVLILISGRTGDTLESSTHWMGWRFAQKGYRVIAPSMRISGVTGIQTETMAHVREDIGLWINKVSSRGMPRIVLGGHSNGGIWISDYEAATHDPRVVGMAYFAPTVDAQTYKRKQVGDAEYERQDKLATQALSDGRRDFMMGLESAVAFSELYGSKAATEHSVRVRDIHLPGIAFAGGQDPLMSDWFLQKFRAGYAGRLTMVRYDNGSHGFRESKDQLANDLANWLDKTFR